MANPVNNPLDDFSRLYNALPGVHGMVTRAQSCQTVNFLKEVLKNEVIELDKVPPTVATCISKVIDESTLKTYNHIVRLLQGSEEHRKHFVELRDDPVRPIKYQVGYMVLKEVPAFEQMVALDHLISVNAFKQVGRFAFDDRGDDVIPVVVGRNQRGSPVINTMNTMLGSPRGRLTAPKYTDMAKNADQTTFNSPFRNPLAALEIVRQPHYGATLFKEACYDVEVIDEEERYGTEGVAFRLACAELKGQNDPRNTPKKNASSGYSLLQCAKKEFEKDSGNLPVHKELQFEDFANEGYDDEWGQDSTTASSYLRSVLESVEKSITAPLDTSHVDTITKKLFASVIGPSTSRRVNNYFTGKDDL